MEIKSGRFKSPLPSSIQRAQLAICGGIFQAEQKSTFYRQANIPNFFFRLNRSNPCDRNKPTKAKIPMMAVIFFSSLPLYFWKNILPWKITASGCTFIAWKKKKRHCWPKSATYNKGNIWLLPTIRTLKRYTIILCPNRAKRWIGITPEKVRMYGKSEWKNQNSR